MTTNFEVGDLLHRVDGSCVGETIAEGVELQWLTYRAIKVTRCGAWFTCETWPYKRRRFALSSGCRWGHRTKAGALDQLLARKRLHIAILESRLEEAQQVRALALSAKLGYPA